MKSVKIMSVVLLIGVVLVLAACATSEEKANRERIRLESEVTTVTVEHKGTGLGIDQLPIWITAYMNSGASGIERLAEYKDVYAIVAEENGTALQPLLTWVNNFNAQQQIGATINTRIASLFQANEHMLPNTDEAVRSYNNSINTLVSASYTGARKDSDWWIKQRIEEKGKESETRYRAIVLYTIPKTTLNEQIAQQLKQLAEGNPELDEVFNAITAQLLEEGLNSEPAPAVASTSD
ncbi:MAG: hypothetical protein LBJ41_07260 [Treponema sp.]|jgi:hypothetical protein|nr:hypothetical protein [Treponema sp.]